MAKTYLKPKEVADRCGVKVATVWAWCRSGKLKCVKIGTRIRIEEESIREVFE